MKKPALYLVILVTCVFSACRPSGGDETVFTGENLVQNPSFETGEDAPGNWEKLTFRNSPEPEYSWDFDPQRHGKVAGLEFTQTGAAGLRQELHLEPDGQYHLTAQVRTGNIEGRGQGASVFFPGYRWMQPPSLKKADEWTTLEADIVNAGFTKLDIMCAMGLNGGNTGYVRFDDLSLRKMVDPAQDPRKTRELDFGAFKLRINRDRGTITSLRPGAAYPDAPEFLGSYPTLPYLNEAKDHFLGDIAMDVRVAGAWKTVTTADTGITRDISINKSSLEITSTFPEMPEAPEVTTTWQRDGDGMIWSIELSNTSTAPLTIGTLEFPLPWNDNYCLFDPHDKASQKLLYTRRVAEHKHIGGLASYVLACPMDGTPPMLVVSPGDRQSPFEFTYHAVDSIRNQRRDPNRWIHGAWPGLTRICFHSAGVIEKQDWTPWLADHGRNSHTKLTITPGESRKYTVRFQWIDTRKSLPAQLGETGLLGVRLIPGPAAPAGQPVTAIVTGAKPPLTVEGADHWEERVLPSGVAAVTFTVNKEGKLPITLTDSTGAEAVVYFASLAPVDELMVRRSQFILNKQVQRVEDTLLTGAILCYDNRQKNVLAVTDDMWGSGGYEGGVTDAQFMAMKNRDIPDRDEIAYLETYIHDWLIGGIQDPTHYGVAWMVAAPGRIERGYNYIHVLNLYDAMIRTAATWPSLFTHDAGHYLDLWWNTFAAFNKQQVRFRDLGLMGRGNMTFMPELFRRYGQEDRAVQIEQEIRQWAEYWAKDPAYPYGSELFFDNTGYETVVLYCDYVGKKALAKQTVEVTLAGRGRAPSWFWNDSDQRWWDAVRTAPQYYSFTDFGENCHHYMTGLNGYMLLEAYDAGYLRDEPMPPGLSGIFTSWTRVDPDGFAGMCYCPDPSSDNYGLNQFTGDVGLGLWGNLMAARCVVVTDPLAGLTAHGGTLIDTEKPGITVNPYPGMDHRIRLPEHNLEVDLTGPAITEFHRDGTTGELTIQMTNRAEYPCAGRLVITGLAPGQYILKKGDDPEVPMTVSNDPWVQTRAFAAGESLGVVVAEEVSVK